jgi:hypothetical protein
LLTLVATSTLSFFRKPGIQKQHSTIMLTSAQIKSLVYASLTEPQQEAVEQSYAVTKGLLATAISMTPMNWSPSSP